MFSNVCRGDVSETPKGILIGDDQVVILEA